MAILGDPHPDAATVRVQNQIRQGIRAIILHPHTPDRALTKLAACMYITTVSDYHAQHHRASAPSAAL